MICLNQFVGRWITVLYLLCVIVGCKPGGTSSDEAVLRIGVIVSNEFDGPARARDTVRCAELIAAGYNRDGGVLVDGIPYRVELHAVDYGDDSMQAVRLASHLIHNEGVRYFIGPDSGSPLDAVVPLYQAAGALFVHSDVNFDAGEAGGLSLRGASVIKA